MDQLSEGLGNRFILRVIHHYTDLHLFQRLLLTALLIAILSAVWGCTPKVPGAPVWTVQGSIPFQTKSYRLSELLTDSAHLADKNWGIYASPTDSLLQFVYEDSISKRTIEDKITVQPTPANVFTNNFGEIKLQASDPYYSQIKASKLDSSLKNIHNQPLPRTDFSDVKDTLNFSSYHWMHVSTGQMHLTVNNDYPFPLQNLDISMYNLSAGDLIDNHTFNQTIASGGSAECDLTLQGKTIEDSLLLVFKGTVPANPNQVNIDGGELLRIVSQIGPTEIDSGNAKIDQQSVAKMDSISIVDSNKVVWGKISDGAVICRLDNTTPTRQNATITFLNLLDSSGIAIVKNLLIEPRTVNIPLVIDLTGCTVQMRLDWQYLLLNTAVVSEDSRVTLLDGTPYQTLHSEDGLTVNWRTSLLKFSEINGTVDSVSIPVNTADKRISLPEEADSARIVAGNLYLNFINTTAAPLHYSADLTGFNEKRGTTTVLPIEIARVDPGENHFVLTDTVGLLQSIPNVFRLTGAADFGTHFFPETRGVITTFHSDDGLSGELRYEAGMKGGMTAVDHMDSAEVVDFTLDYPIEKMALSVDVINTIPLSGTMYFLMGNDTATMFQISEISFPLGTIVNHRMSEPYIHRFEIPIEPKFYDIIKGSPIYVQPSLHYDGTMGEEVWLYADDSLRTQAALTVYYQVDPGDNVGD